MSQPGHTGGRLRAYLQFLAAILYFFLARSLAFHGARGFVGDAWFPLVEQTMLAFLLLVGFATMGFWLDRQTHPISAQGLPRREGWPREAGLGLAIGWGVALVCVLPMMLAGGIAISLFTQASSWGWLVADAAFFAVAALAEEVAYRGYAFQCFIRAVGPVGAVLGFAAIYAILQALNPGASRVSFIVSLAFSFLLSTAYLRTRALWVSWGLNFGWKASRALVFGLAVSGVSSHSPVVQGDPMGPFWLTGGAYGLDGSWLACVVLLAAIPVVFRVTRDLDFRYNAPVIVSGGIPVDLDAAARAQHEAAMGAAAPAAPALVQIETQGAGSTEQGTENPATPDPPQS
ncbi:MAG: CPBP family intramembrane glutamic endopeptidase [Terracidiphilus sp.]